MIPESYPTFLADLKQRIAAARLKASLAVNREMVMLYWSIGRDIIAKQKQEGWGAHIIPRLSKDLRAAFPETKGFSPSNLGYMRAFAEAYPDEAIFQAVLGKLTWYHNIALIDKVKSPQERTWYAEQTIENGWSRNVHVLHIKSRLYDRQGKALTNFSRTLPSPQSDLAQALTKDTYNFDFLGISSKAREREIERGLVDHIRDFILELGKGFAFIGSQYHLQVNRKDYYLDLLFYHYRLHCFVVFDLKAREFRPEDTGKMNFYLSAVDDLVRGPEDKNSIGIILCEDRGAIEVEYALRDVNKPMGIAEYKVTPDLPKPLQTDLPTIEEINAEFQPKKPRGRSVKT